MLKPLHSGLVELNQKETLLKYQALHSPPVTPVRVERLECLLHCYEQNKKHFLVDGFRCGFRVNFVGDRLPFQSPNLKSVLELAQTFFFFSRVGKSLACHSPAKWCHCGVFVLTFEGVGVMRTFLWCTQEDI